MVSDIVILLSAAAISISLAVALITFFKMKDIQRKMLLQASLIEKNQENIRSLFSGAAGVGDHLIRTEQLIKRIAERQDQLDLSDVSNHSYDHAIKLIQNGAECEEIISQCGLVREEAALLVQMYRYDKAS